MTGPSKRQRRPDRDTPGKVAPQAGRKAATTRKQAAPVMKKTPAPAPAEVLIAQPEPVEIPQPAPAPELTAADLMPTEDITITEEYTETTPETIEVNAPSLPAVEEIAEEATESPAEAKDQAEQKGTEIMNDVIENTKKFAEDAKGRFEAAFVEMSEKAKASVEKSSKAFEQINELAKGNVEALVESGKIASKGVETLGQDAAEYGRLTFEKASAALKSLAAAKSPAEFFQLQSELLSSNFDAFAKEAAKNSEAFLKLAGEVAQPISTRVSIMTEKVRSIAA